MQNLTIKTVLILTLASSLSILLIGCGKKDEEKPANGQGGYYTGPLQGKNAGAKGKPMGE